MIYSVVWDPAAENELTTIWLASSDRNRVTRAAAVIEARLVRDAANEGESRPGNRRVTFERPLSLLFRVNEMTRVVRVLHVWTFR